MMSAEEPIVYPDFQAELDAIDYSEIEKQFECNVNDNFGNILIIDQLPKVDVAKEEKLLAVLKKKVFTPVNANLVSDGIFMPKDEEGLGKGYGFFEFESVDQAVAAYGAIHNFRLDKQHTLYAIRFNEFERLSKMEETYVEPNIEEYQEKEYLKDWLNDKMARDQFATLGAGNMVQVCWGPRNGAPELVEERKPWTDAYIQWSPKGSYLATVHGPGVMIWGGKSWSRLGRFPHEKVKFISFSPCETFLVTMNIFDPATPNEPNMLVWDVHTGKLVRGFVVEAPTDDSPMTWPLLKFSFDDKYAAWAHNGHLSIYETSVPGFGLLDKKSLEVPNIKEISWSPVDYKLVYWTPETDNNPARVALMEIPSKNIIRTKNLFSVDSCHIHWHPDGEYLCVQVTRHGKNKKSQFTNLEIFRLKEKNIPVEVLETKELIAAVAWEPHGDRLLTAYIVDFKAIVNIYTMKATDNGGASSIKLLHTVERKQVDRFFWSPAGNYLVMADLGSTNAFLEFWNANDMSLLATKDHFLATDVQWDPSGRYVTSFVSIWKHSSDTGYCIWDTKGDLITKQNQPRFATFLWRPRPPTLLSGQKLKEIKKNLRTYASVFEEDDLRALSLESNDIAITRSLAIKEWNNFRRRCMERAASLKAKREAIVGTVSDDTPATIAEEWIEEIVEESETVAA